MNIEDIQAVISSAKARGTEPLERYIRRRLPDPSEQEVEEVASVAVEVIDTIPILLARAGQEAESRELTRVVDPLLEHAATYFMQPMDLIPEMTQGLAGLLDDAYLVLRMLQNLNRGAEPLLQSDLEEPLRFIQSLVGPRVAGRLDELALEAMDEVSDNLTRFWTEMAREA